MVRPVKPSPTKEAQDDHHRPGSHEPRHRRDASCSARPPPTRTASASSSRRSSSRTAPSPPRTCTRRRRSASRSSAATLEFRVGTRDDRREARRPRPRPGRDGPPASGTSATRPRTSSARCRPALGFEQLIETMFSLAADGKVNRKGMPNPLRLAVIATAPLRRRAAPLPARLDAAAGARHGRADRPAARVPGHLRARRPGGTHGARRLMRRRVQRSLARLLCRFARPSSARQAITT